MRHAQWPKLREMQSHSPIMLAYVEVLIVDRMSSPAKVKAGTAFLVNGPSDSSVRDFHLQLTEYLLHIQTNQAKNARLRLMYVAQKLQ